METMKDYKARDAIVGVTEDDYRGGVAHFEGLTVESLTKLVEMDFADPDEQQNSAPTIAEILDFMLRNPRFTAHGYVVDPRRADVRVSLEGVALNEKPTDKERDDFVSTFRHADDFSFKTNCYAWFD